jgi:putative phage-type endonuclease
MMPTTTDRDHWLEARRAGIGASDAAVILGVSKWKSPLQLFAEKTGLADVAESEKDYLTWGHRLEPVIASAYEDETGRTTFDPGDYAIQRHSHVPWMIATIDRLVTRWPEDSPHRPPVEIPGAPGVLELKTTNAFRREEWKDEPPLAYQIQLQHQMAVTGHMWGSIAVLIGGQSFLWTDIARNQDFIDKLMTAEEKFWMRVLRRDAPEPDASRSASQILQALYPRETEPAIELPIEAIDWDRDRTHAIEVIRNYEDIKNECENRLKAAIGPHEAGVLASGARYAWKASERKGYTVAPSTTRILRRTAQ